MKNAIKEIIEFCKEDPMETIGSIIGWTSILSLVFMSTVIF